MSGTHRIVAPAHVIEMLKDNGLIPSDLPVAEVEEESLDEEFHNFLAGGSKQVGGDHYEKHAIQPWDIIDEYNLTFYEGSILKYLLRHRDKGGVEDLKKARHTLNKLISTLEE